MSAALVRVILNCRADAQWADEFIRPLADDSPATLRRLAAWIMGMAGGVHEGIAEVCTGSVAKATGTIVFTDNPSAAEAFLFGTVTITARDGDASGQNEFNYVSDGVDAAADAAGTATALAACINAHTTLNKFLSASASAGTVTVTVEVPGEIGNHLKFAEDTGGVSNCTTTAPTSGSNGTLTDLVVGSVS